MSKIEINTIKSHRFKLLEALESQLKSHDWFYEYSDDHRYYNSGLKERDEIWRTIEEIQEIAPSYVFDQAIDMYKKYKPVIKYHEREIGRNY